MKLFFLQNDLLSRSKIIYFLLLLFCCRTTNENVRFYNLAVGNRFELMKVYGSEFAIQSFGNYKKEIIDMILTEGGESNKQYIQEKFSSLSDDDFIIGIKLTASKDISSSLDQHKFLVNGVQYDCSVIFYKNLFLLDNGVLIDEYLTEKESTPFARKRPTTNKIHLIKQNIFQYTFWLGIKSQEVKNRKIEFKNLTEEKILIP